MVSGFQIGDRVIYRVTKRSWRPGQRAHDVYPEPNGDGYTYAVDKYWVVEATPPDGDIVVRTRRGKIRTVRSDDPNLVRPTWWQSILYAQRFPQPTK